MSDNLVKFREFVEEHPLIKESVKNKERTWQEYYEDFIILGPYDSGWKKYKQENEPILDSEKVEETKKVKSTKKDSITSTEFWKTAYSYVKKIDSDKVTKTLGNAQKVLGLFQGFVGGGVGGAATGFKKTGDPLFDKKFDDWY